MRSTNMASLHGSTSLYQYLPARNVLVQKDGYNYMVATVRDFQRLFIELNAERAALKEDCIEYVVYRRDMSFEDCPQWYIQAIEDGYIYCEEGYEDYIFYCEHGDIVLNPGSVILRNYKGELRCMEPDEFIKYYEILEVIN